MTETVLAGPQLRTMHLPALCPPRGSGAFVSSRANRTSWTSTPRGGEQRLGVQVACSMALSGYTFLRQSALLHRWSGESRATPTNGIASGARRSVLKCVFIKSPPLAVPPRGFAYCRFIRPFPSEHGCLACPWPLGLHVLGHRAAVSLA